MKQKAVRISVIVLFLTIAFTALLRQGINADTLLDVGIDTSNTEEGEEVTLNGIIHHREVFTDDNQTIAEYFLATDDGNKYTLINTAGLPEDNPVTIKGHLDSTKTQFNVDSFKRSSNKIRTEQINDEPRRTTGTVKLAVFLINFSDDRSQFVSSDKVKQTLFAPAPAKSLDSYFVESSYGKMTLTGDVFGWHKVPYKRDVCDKEEKWKESSRQAATATGANLADYDYYAFVYNSPNCRGGAFAAHSLRTMVYNYGSFENGINSFAHELGHLMGLRHAQGLVCANEQNVETRIPVSMACIGGSDPYANYLDIYSMMGVYGNMHYNGYYKLRLNWFESSNVKEVTSSGKYTLTPLAKKSNKPQILLIPKKYQSLPACGATPEIYIVEYRQRGGWDQGSNVAPLDNVQVRVGSSQPVGYYEGCGESSNLVDTDTRDKSLVPMNKIFTNSPLYIGEELNDTLNGVKIRVISAGSGIDSKAEIEVTFTEPTTPPVLRTPLISWVYTFFEEVHLSLNWPPNTYDESMQIETWRATDESSYSLIDTQSFTDSVELTSDHYVSNKLNRIKVRTKKMIDGQEVYSEFSPSVELYFNQSGELDYENFPYFRGSIAKISAPTDFKATKGSGRTIRLRWRDTTVNEDGFELWRATKPNGAYKRIATLFSDTSNYADKNLESGQTYYYKIRTMVFAWKNLYSSYSNIVSLKVD